MMVLLGTLLAVGTAAAVPATTPSALQKPVLPKPVPATPARPTRAQVMAAVRSEWARYDSAGTGRLTPLAFSTWVMHSHGGTVAARARGSGIAPVSAMNASATAFSRADANHDGGVTPDEMTSFLMLPPTPTASAKLKAARGSVASAKALPSAQVIAHH